jgi:hypothetical protein
MKNNTLIIFAIPTLACQVENKLYDIDPQMIEGECNLESPPFVPDSDKPVAVCNSDRLNMAPLRDNAELFGSESYDPNNLDLIDYQWKLVEQPEGSSFSLLEQNSSNRTFTPDLAGEYVFELMVTNEECAQSEPCQLSIVATPAEDLWIELSWEHSGDDLDLHLIKQGSRFESEGDCYYGNCVSDVASLDWGIGGLLDDNPRLDLDDIEGVGPENINIQEPSQGNYTVMIHDYPGSEYSSNNTALVKIHLTGELVFERSVVITGEDSKIEVANILWPSLEVESLVD